MSKKNAKKPRKIGRTEASRLNATAIAADRLIRYYELNGPELKRNKVVINYCQKHGSPDLRITIKVSKKRS